MICKKGKGKSFPYSIPSVGPGADPAGDRKFLRLRFSMFADTARVTNVRIIIIIIIINLAVGCHYFPPGLRLPPQPQSITALLAGTKLYCLVTEAHRCKQLA